MRREARVFPALVPLACLVIAAATCAWSMGEQPAHDAQAEHVDNDEGEPQQDAESATDPPAQPKPELSPEMAELRDAVRRTLLRYYRQPLSTQSNTPADLIHCCLAFGCDTEVRTSNTSSRSRGSSAKTVSGIGVLSWNYPCAGRYLLASDDGRFISRVGYGYQKSPGQFLAVLAMSQVDPDYEIRVAEQHGTVADLVRCEQLHCQSGTDLSFVLIGLAHYLPTGATWENDLGEAWSLERLIKHELDRSPDHSSEAAVHQLIGLSLAVERRVHRGEPVDGQFVRAAKFVTDFQSHALKLQNPDGSWHPRFFASRGPSGDTLGVLRSTGHILQWLVLSLPEDRLQDSQVVAAVTRVNSVLAGRSSRQYVSSMSPRDIETMMHALAALAVYDRRVFKPTDPDPVEPASEEK